MLVSRPDLADVPDESGDRLLHYAALKGDIDTAKLLMELGVSINARNYFDITPLHNAVHNCRADMIDLLAQSGADLYAKDKAGWTPVMCAGINRVCDPEVLVGQLRKLGAALDLNTAVRIQSIDDVAILLQHPDAIAIAPQPRELLGETVTLNNIELLSMLLAKGADPNVADGQGATPLHLACGRPNASLDMVSLLINRGADPHLPCRGMTPLETARGARNDAIASYLESRIND